MTHPGAGLDLELPVDVVAAEPVGDDVPEDRPWAGADYEPGDVLLVHCLTLHRALPNRDPAGQLRLSADFRFRPEAMRRAGR